MRIDGKADGYVFGKEEDTPCGASMIVTITPTGVVKSCHIVILGELRHSSLRDIILSRRRLQLLHGEQEKMFPACGKHDYCRYCRPCFAGEKFDECEDEGFVVREIQGDLCIMARTRMELCQQIEQGIDPLGGKTIEECLEALPEEEVPVFRKKI